MTAHWLILSGALLGQVDPSSPNGPGVAQTTQSTESSTDRKLQIRRLLRQLDGDELKQRMAAEQRLIGLGPQILSLLPEADRNMSAEVKERLGRVRNALEKAAAATATNASVVTLHGEMSLSNALRSLEQQTGNRVVDYEKHGGRVTVDFTDTAYWEALDAILDQVGLSINPYGGYTAALALVSRPDSAPPRSDRAVYNGIFRFEAIQVSAVRDLRNPAVDAARITLEVGWEPRTMPISLGIRADQIQAVDPAGQRIGIDSNQTELQAMVQAEIPVVEFIIPLELPAREMKKIASLKGTLSAMIPGRRETFKFSNLESSRNVQQRRAGVTVTFERLRKNLQLYEVRMRAQFDQAANALESHRGWIYNNPAYLVDADGQKIMPATFETTRQEFDEVGMAYLFDLQDGPQGYSFYYETPAAILRMPVEFSANEIPLP